MKITISVEADSIGEAVSKLREQIGQYEAMAQTVAHRKAAPVDVLKEDPAGAEHTVEDVRVALRDVLAAPGKGMKTIEKLLAQFGASEASSVPAARRAEIIAAARAELS